MRSIVLILQNIRSLHNVGSLFRSADVFGVRKIYLCGYTGVPPRREIEKVALGAETWVPWEHRARAADVVRALRRQGYQVIALETGKGSRPIQRAVFGEKTALIVGNEVTGVTPPVLRLADCILRIPLFGKKESLNVSVAAGVGLFAVRFRRPTSPRRRLDPS